MTSHSHKCPNCDRWWKCWASDCPPRKRLCVECCASKKTTFLKAPTSSSDRAVHAQVPPGLVVGSPLWWVALACLAVALGCGLVCATKRVETRAAERADGE